MFKRFFIVYFLLSLLFFPHLLAYDKLIKDALNSLEKGIKYFHSISTNGGYLWEYSVDLKERWGEGEATDTQIWVQPPGTPSVGETILSAYKVTGERFYLSCAEDAADALIWGQKKPGGWEYKIDFKSTPKNDYCTFDDNNTQSALRFLMALDMVIQKKSPHDAVEKGLDFMLESQFENGAWPQWYPLRGGYHDYFTFNDEAINDCIRVMIDAYDNYGKIEYLRSVEKGGDFIILSQIPTPQSGWAQQYNHSLQPDWGRSFEPPAVCSRVTGNCISTLTDLYLYTGKEKYLEPIPDAIQWLMNSRLPDGVWARFYELETNRPIYCDRDRKIFYNIEELSEERRTGYSYQGKYGIEKIINYYNTVKELGRDDYLKNKNQPLLESEREKKLNNMETSIRNIIASQDENGRWISEDRIRSNDFIKNVKSLCDYIEIYYYDDESPSLHLVSYEIFQNYPNPFNQKTTIEYKVPEYSEVKIEIYNIIGQKVKTLINDEYSPGYYEVLWDGTNEQGKPVSSGQYIAQLRAQNVVQCIKILYIR